MSTRVQIPAYTDRWMMGDRFGVVVKVTRKPARLGVRTALLTSRPHESEREIAHVKLDKSGKTMRFVYADCQDVS